MDRIYRISYKFSIENMNKDIVSKSVEYWESRRFKCQKENNKIVGKRGNALGNLFSFDMTKLICELSVEFLENKISVEFLINGRFQDITDVNLASFEIEQLLFPYYLKNESNPEFLNKFMVYNKKSAIKWTFSLTTLGRNLSDELKTKIESLANGNDYPKVEIE